MSGRAIYQVNPGGQLTFARSVGADENAAFRGICWVCVERLVSGLVTALAVVDAMLCTQAGSLVSASYTHAVIRCAQRVHVGRSPEHLTFESRQATQERKVRFRLMPRGSSAALDLFTPEVRPPFWTQFNCSLSQFKHPSGRSSHLTYVGSICVPCTSGRSKISWNFLPRTVLHVWSKVLENGAEVRRTFLARQVAQADAPVSRHSPQKDRVWFTIHRTSALLLRTRIW